MRPLDAGALRGYSFRIETFHLHLFGKFLSEARRYIHTDATDEALARAKRPNKWTRLILNTPGVLIGKEIAPSMQATG